MKLETFDFNAVPVRVMVRDDAPWFVAADVCRVLDIVNSRDAVSGLDEDEKATVGNTDSRPGQPGAKSFQIISESGLYALVFKSRKAEAKAFRKWVTSEVLPTIRKTGRYETPVMEELEDRLSLMAFVRQACHGWSLERQTEFGMQVRRYSKAMGVVFQVGTEPGVGRVFTFPRQVLETVRVRYQQASLLPDSDAVEFERLLEAMHRCDGGAKYEPEVARGIAKTMGLFPSIFGPNTSLASERSGFGRLCERFHRSVFPSGLSLAVRGEGNRRRYEVSKTTPELALST